MYPKNDIANVLMKLGDIYYQVLIMASDEEDASDRARSLLVSDHLRYDANTLDPSNFSMSDGLLTDKSKIKVLNVGWCWPGCEIARWPVSMRPPEKGVAQVDRRVH